MATSIGSLFASIVLSTEGLSKDIATAEGKLRKFSQKLEGFANDLTLKLSAPLAAFGAVSVKSFADFEKGMAEVQTITNASTAEFRKLESGVRDLSKRIGLDLGDSVKGLYEALSANVPRENALSFLEVAAKAGIAGVTTTKTSVDGLTSALNAYKIPAANAAEISDKFFIAVRNGKTNFEQLAGSIGQVLPTASAFGVSLDEVLASVASLTKQGVKTTESMTQLKAAMVALAKPNKDMAVLLDDLGFGSGTAMLKSLGLVGSLEALRLAAGDLDTLTAALGSTEALGAAMALTGANAQTFQADLADVRGAAGATDKAFATMDGTTSAAMAKLKASLTDLAVTVGQILVPAITPLVDKVKSLADGFAQLDPGTQAAVVQAGAFVAILGPMLILVAKVGSSIATLLGWGRQLWMLLGGLTLAGGNLTAVLGWIATAITSLPVAIAAAGLALGAFLSQFEVFQKAGDELGGIIYWLYDLLKNLLVDAWDGLTEAVSSSWAALKEFASNLKEIFAAPLNWLTAKLDWLADAFANLGESALSLTGSPAALGPGGRSSMAGRASGGPVQAGASYLVGEHGPELFTPAIGGSIASAADLRQATPAAAPAITLQLSAGVPSAVRAEVQALLPQITRQIERALLGAADRPGPWGRALRA